MILPLRAHYILDHTYFVDEPSTVKSLDDRSLAIYRRSAGLVCEFYSDRGSPPHEVWLCVIRQGDLQS